MYENLIIYDAVEVRLCGNLITNEVLALPGNQFVSRFNENLIIYLSLIHI